MHTVPIQRGGPRPVVDVAEAAIIAFGGGYCSRQLAANLLGSWQHNLALTDDERRAVLARFPAETPPPLPEYVEGIPIGGRR